MRFGDGLALLVLLIWVPIELGYPFAALGLFVGAMLLNELEDFLKKRAARNSITAAARRDEKEETV